MKDLHYSAAAGRSGKVIAARIFPDLDIIEAIEEICADYGIQYGQVSCIGSLRKICMNYVSTATPESGKGYTTRLELEGAFSLLAGQGLVSPSEEPGKLNSHLHFVISGQHDVIYGGHVERGTRTLTTTDLFITELLGVGISRSKDPVTGAVVTSFKENLE